MLTDKDRAVLATNPKGYRKRIDLMCKECIFDPLGGAGTWRQQVEGCSVVLCPLYEVRPVSRPKKAP